MEWVRSYIDRKVAKYIDRDYSQSTGSWTTLYDVTNVSLKSAALFNANLPVTVVKSHVGQLTVSLSLRGLEICLKDVFVVISPARMQAVSAQELKKEIIRQMEDSIKKTGESYNIAYIVSWINKVVIESIHIRFEDDLVQRPDEAVAAGILLNRLQASHDTSKGKHDFKIAELAQFRVYCDVIHEPSRFLLQNSDRWQVLMKYALDEGMVKEKRLDFVVPSLDGKLVVESCDNASDSAHKSCSMMHMKVTFASTTAATSPPKGTVPRAVETLTKMDSPVTVRVSQEQFSVLQGIMDTFEQLKISCRFRPQQAVRENTRAWWQYAVNTTLGKTVCTFNIDYMMNHRKNYKAYRQFCIEFFENYEKWSPNKRRKVRDSLASYEATLDEVNICLAREEAANSLGSVRWRLRNALDDVDGDDFEDALDYSMDDEMMEQNEKLKRDKELLKTTTGDVVATIKCPQIDFKLLMGGRIIFHSEMMGPSFEYVHHTDGSFRFIYQLMNARAFGLGVNNKPVDILLPVSQAGVLKAASVLLNRTSMPPEPLFTFHYRRESKQETSATAIESVHSRVIIQLDHLVALYNKNAVSELMGFFSSSENVDSVRNYLEDTVSDYSRELMGRLREKERLSVEFKIRSPALCVPEFGDMEKCRQENGYLLVVDFGDVTANDPDVPFAKDTEPDDDQQTQGYHKYLIHISSVKAIFVNYVQNWPKYLKTNDDSITLIPEMAIDVHLETSVSNKIKPWNKLSVSTESVKLNCTESQIELLLNFFTHPDLYPTSLTTTIPSFKAGANLLRSDTNSDSPEKPSSGLDRSKSRRLNRPREDNFIRLVPLIRKSSTRSGSFNKHRAQKTIREEDISGSTDRLDELDGLSPYDIRRCKSDESLDIDEIEASQPDDPSQKKPPFFTKSLKYFSRYKNPILLEMQFKLEKAVVTLRLHSFHSKTDTLVLLIEKVKMKIGSMLHGLAVITYLTRMTLTDNRFMDPLTKGNIMPLRAEPATKDAHFLLLAFRQINPKCPVFAKGYDSTTNRFDLMVGQLDLVLHRKAVLDTLELVVKMLETSVTNTRPFQLPKRRSRLYGSLLSISSFGDAEPLKDIKNSVEVKLSLKVVSQMHGIGLRLCVPGLNLASAALCSLSVLLDCGPDKRVLSTGLNKLDIKDLCCEPGEIYPDIFTTLDDSLIQCKAVFMKLSKKPQTDLSSQKQPAASTDIRVTLGKSQIVYLNKFIQKILRFSDGIVSLGVPKFLEEVGRYAKRHVMTRTSALPSVFPSSPGVPGSAGVNQPLGSSLQIPRKGFLGGSASDSTGGAVPGGSKLSLQVKLQAPEIILPRSSTSLELLCVSPGKLIVTTEIAHNSQGFPKFNTHLDKVKVARMEFLGPEAYKIARETSTSGKPVSLPLKDIHTIVPSVQLMTMRIVYHDNTSSVFVSPQVTVKVHLSKDIKVYVTALDIALIKNILAENLTEQWIMPKKPNKREPSHISKIQRFVSITSDTTIMEEGDREAATREAEEEDPDSNPFDSTSDEPLNFELKVLMQAFKVALYEDRGLDGPTSATIKKTNPSAESSTSNDDPCVFNPKITQIGLLEIINMTFVYKSTGRNSSEMRCLLENTTLYDMRPERSEFIKTIIERENRSKQAPVYMISYEHIIDENKEYKTNITIEALSLNLVIPFCRIMLDCLGINTKPTPPPPPPPPLPPAVDAVCPQVSVDTVDSDIIPINEDPLSFSMPARLSAPALRRKSSWMLARSISTVVGSAVLRHRPSLFAKVEEGSEDVVDNVIVEENTQPLLASSQPTPRRYVGGSTRRSGPARIQLRAKKMEEPEVQPAEVIPDACGELNCTFGGLQVRLFSKPEVSDSQIVKLFMCGQYTQKETKEKVTSVMELDRIEAESGFYCSVANQPVLLLPILSRCAISLHQTLTKETKCIRIKLEVEGGTLKFNVSNSFIETIKQTLTELSEDHKEQTTANIHRTNLWDTKPTPDHRWMKDVQLGVQEASYQSPTVTPVKAAEIESEEFTCKIDRISLIYFVLHDNIYKPTLSIKSGVDAKVVNWNSKISIHVDRMPLNVHFHNPGLALWEPLIEPISMVPVPKDTSGAPRKMQTPSTTDEIEVFDEKIENEEKYQEFSRSYKLSIHIYKAESQTLSAGTLDKVCEASNSPDLHENLLREHTASEEGLHDIKYTGRVPWLVQMDEDKSDKEPISKADDHSFTPTQKSENKRRFRYSSSRRSTSGDKLLLDEDKPEDEEDKDDLGFKKIFNIPEKDSDNIDSIDTNKKSSPRKTLVVFDDTDGEQQEPTEKTEEEKAEEKQIKLTTYLHVHSTDQLLFNLSPVSLTILSDIATTLTSTSQSSEKASLKGAVRLVNNTGLSLLITTHDDPAAQFPLKTFLEWENCAVESATAPPEHFQFSTSDINTHRETLFQAEDDEDAGDEAGDEVGQLISPKDKRLSPHKKPAVSESIRSTRSMRNDSSFLVHADDIDFVAASLHCQIEGYQVFDIPFRISKNQLITLRPDVTKSDNDTPFNLLVYVEAHGSSRLIRFCTPIVVHNRLDVPLDLVIPGTSADVGGKEEKMPNCAMKIPEEGKLSLPYDMYSRLFLTSDTGTLSSKVACFLRPQGYDLSSNPILEGAKDPHKTLNTTIASPCTTIYCPRLIDSRGSSPAKTSPAPASSTSKAPQSPHTTKTAGCSLTVSLHSMTYAQKLSSSFHSPPGPSGNSNTLPGSRSSKTASLRRSLMRKVASLASSTGRDGGLLSRLSEPLCLVVEPGIILSNRLPYQVQCFVAPEEDGQSREGTDMHLDWTKNIPIATADKDSDCHLLDVGLSPNENKITLLIKVLDYHGSDWWGSIYVHTERTTSRVASKHPETFELTRIPVLGGPDQSRNDRDNGETAALDVVDSKGKKVNGSSKTTCKEHHAKEKRCYSSKRTVISYKVERVQMSVKVVIYACYWVINNTPVELDIKSTKGEYLHCPAESPSPVIFSVKSHFRKKVRFRVTNSHWSDTKVTLDAVDLPGLLNLQRLVASQSVVPATPAPTSGCQGTTVEQVQLLLHTKMSAILTETKLVTLTPNFIFTNTSTRGLIIREIDIGTNKIALPGVQESEKGKSKSASKGSTMKSHGKTGTITKKIIYQTLSLQPDEKMAFFPQGPSQKSLMTIEYADGEEGETETPASSVQSKAFSFFTQCTTVLKMPGGTAIVVDVMGGINAPYVIIFENYDEGDSPVRFENRCTKMNLDLQIRQKNEKTETILKPGEQLLYTWDSPIGLRDLEWSVSDSLNYYPVKIDQDSLGFETPFDSTPSCKIYWTSFVDGVQRVFMILDDAALSSKASRISERESCVSVLHVDLYSLGVSLITGTSSTELAGRCLEVALITAAPPSPTWYLDDRALGMVDNIHLEDAYRLKSTHKVLVDDVQINVRDMKVVRNPKRTVKRIQQPGICLFYAQSEHNIVFLGKIHHIQVDNQLPDAVFITPICPAPVSRAKRRLNKPISPFLEIEYMHRAVPENNINTVHRFSVKLQKFFASFDLGFVLTVQNILSCLSKDSKPLDIDSTDVDVKHITALRANRILFRKIYISPIQMHLSFSMEGHVYSASSESRQGGAFLTDLLFKLPTKGLGNTKEVEISLSGINETSTSKTWSDLSTFISAHFTDAVKKRLLLLLFGLDVLGNPYQFFVTLSHGFKDLARNTMDGEQGFLVGLKSLGKHSTSAITNSLARASASVGGTLTNLSLDKQYIQERRRRFQRAKTPLTCAKAAGNSIGFGLLLGVSGIVLNPKDEIRRKGAVGFLPGVGIGVLGIVVKPLSGFFDMTSLLMDALKRHVEDGNVLIYRQRIPRHIHPLLGIQPFSQFQSEGERLLQRVDGSFYVNRDLYWVHGQIEGENTFAILTHRQLIEVMYNNIFQRWTMEHEMKLEAILSVTVKENVITLEYIKKTKSKVRELRMADARIARIFSKQIGVVQKMQMIY